jgi:fumarylacetoacetate (FAA) hydrolase
METIQDGQPATEFMKYGDTIRIEMKGRDGLSVFGAIDQDVVPPEVKVRPGRPAATIGQSVALASQDSSKTSKDHE